MKFSSINKLICHRVKGYSLPFAIFIFVIIIIISGTLTLKAYQNYKTTNRFFIMEKMESNAQSALNLIIVHPEDYPYQQSTSLSLYGENMDSVTLRKEQWGAFDIVQSTSSYLGITKNHSALIGSYKYDSSSVALFVPEAGQSIALVGNVNISGVCKLPVSKFSQPSIEGRNFTGSTKASNLSVSSTKLPDLTPRLKNLCYESAIKNIANDKMVPFEEWETDTISIPFFNDTATTIFSSNPIVLDNKHVSGKVMIFSEKSITINRTTKLSDVICFAPYIQVTDGFEGKCQLYASDSICIEESCVFKYPSVIGIHNKTEEHAKLKFNKNSKLMGVAYLYSENSEKSNDILQIESGSTIFGQVYSNKYTEIKGTINGSLYTNKLIVRTPSAIYENTLMDATIDISKLSKNYVGIDILNEGTSGGVIKWLY